METYDTFIHPLKNTSRFLGIVADFPTFAFYFSNCWTRKTASEWGMVVNMSTTKRMDLGLSAWAFVVAMGLVNCQDFFNLRLARWTQVQSLDRYQDVSWMKSQINYKWNNRIHEYKRFSMIQQWMIVHLFSIQSFYVCFFQVRRVLERWKTTWPWGVHNYRRSLGSKWQWNVALKSLSLRMVLARLHNGRMVAGIRLVQSAIQKARF